MIHLYIVFVKSDYSFNIGLWDFTNQLNDGHTRTSTYFVWRPRS